MKKYVTPTMKKLLLLTEDVITASSIINGIVSNADKAASSETQESSWDDSWN